MIEKVEIYKGSYFAQLGDFATSGAMNIITKQRDKDSTLTLMEAATTPNATRLSFRRQKEHFSTLMLPVKSITTMVR